jgi:hypothetical protein
VDELRHLQLGDMRRNQRAGRLISDLAAQPDASIPQASGSLAATKAAYRFLACQGVEAQAIRKAHHARTGDRLVSEPWVLIAQDTTELDVRAHPCTRGVGPLSHPSGQGLLVHSSLAISTQGVPLGLLDQRVWVRDPEQTGRRHQRRRRSAREKESAKWRSAEQAALEAVPQGTRAVLVADREADVYDFLAASRPADVHLLIRATHNRCVAQEPGYLWEALERQPPVGEQVIPVGRSGERTPRRALVSLRYARLAIKPPRHHKQRDRLEPVWVQALLVREQAPPEGVPPLCWLLVSTLPIQAPDDAWRLVHWYSLRWLLERYHYVLKSGCRIESLQPETADRLERALALYWVVAWRLLWLTYLARREPDRSAADVLSGPEWKALYCVTHQTPHPPPAPPPLADAVGWIARLGGFLGRTHDGEPGVKVLWRGMQRLNDIAATWQLLHPTPQDVGNA